MGLLLVLVVLDLLILYGRGRQSLTQVAVVGVRDLVLLVLLALVVVVLVQPVVLVLLVQ